MKPKKMSLANIKGRLSRAEMKKIMAGSDDGGQCGTACSDSTSCQTSPGVNGHCRMPSEGPNAGKCFCVAGY